MKFKVGDNVKICPSSPYYGTSSMNPKDTLGVIKTCTEGDHNIIVEWGKDNENCYNEDDLLFANKAQLNPVFDDMDVQLGESKSLRFNEGKPQFSDLSPEFIYGLMELMQSNRSKYPKRNWALGQTLSDPMDSMMRHYLAFVNGEDNDIESGKNHLLHIASNAMIAYHTLLHYPEKDDRPEKGK